MKELTFLNRTVVPTVVTVLAAALLGGVTRAEDEAGIAEHQVAQARPISLGTSGGNINDRSKRYCCSGTLGALVTDASGKRYILSNNHVLARADQGIPGEVVNQPGMVDQGCQQAGPVATLSRFVSIQFRAKKSRPINYVDAAIAEVLQGELADGKSGDLASNDILDIGTPSATTVPNTEGLLVCKSGRTTGYTEGTITAVDVTVNVGYSTKCGGPSTLTATFADQFVVVGNTETFSAGGDSGSLILTREAHNPVGLLFAGNSTQTIANPIEAVLSSLGVSFIGGEAPAAAAEDPVLESAKVVKARHSEKLFAVAGVHGHGIGSAPNHQPVIRVFVTPAEAGKARAQLPAELEGVPVEIEVAEPFVAY